MPDHKDTAVLHHAHLMTADMAKSVRFWTEHFGGEVVADLIFSGSRNVFMTVGSGRIHLYDQAPNHRGPVNHLGLLVTGLEQRVDELSREGWSTRPIRADDGTGVDYSMVEGPDGLLLELFELDPDNQQARQYFLPPSADPEPTDSCSSRPRLAPSPNSRCGRPRNGEPW